MGEIFKVEFLRRCTWATGGIHKCSWQVRRAGAGVGHLGPWLECRGRPGRPTGQNSGGSASVCGEAPVPPNLSSVCSHGRGSPVCDGLVMVSESTPSSTSLQVCSLRPLCASLLQTSEEIFQHLQNIVDFGKNVMKEFLGENYVHCGVSGFHICSLSSWVQSVSNFSVVVWNSVLNGISSR